MKTFQELKEYLGGFRLGSFPTMKPMASLGDKGPNRPAGQQSLGVGINAAYSSQAPGTMRPFLKAQKKKTVKKEKWSKKYKDSIDCSNPKGFSQKAHCQGKKEETELENYLNKIIEDNPRIPRKKGQKANSKKHSDLYTDENPKGTIHGLKFATVKDAQDSVKKIENSGKKHAHKIQAAVAMEQRAKEMGKTKESAVYRTYIEKMKKITKEKQND
tara:strand:+ start:132 stop:776 length:645 start_codon:yes stop_codon:yes gene_type:complete